MRIAKVLFGCIAVLVTTAEQIEAGMLAVDITGATGSFGGTGFDGTDGYQFTLSHDIVLTSLGVWDHDADGLSDQHQVGIWDSTHTLISQTTVPSGTSGTLVQNSTLGGFRFVNVAPTTLTAGTYVIGAEWFGVGSPDPDDTIFSPFSNSFSTAPQVTLGTRLFTDFQGFVEPTNTIGGNGFGPNFQFDAVSSVPEPSSAALFGLGALGMAVVGARRRRRDNKPETATQGSVQT